MRPLRVGVAVVVVVIMGVAIAGLGMGDAPKSEKPAPAGGALRASKERLAAGGEMVQEGGKEFASEGCASCHAIAAGGRKGALGPRLDTDTDPADEILSSITKPRADIVKGYEANLMPADYAKRMSKDELAAVVAYIKAAAGKEAKGGG
jgi:mono/diheme cytochrome c family protein